MNRRHFVTRLAGSGLLVATAFTAGCTTTGTSASSDPAARRKEIDAGVDGALNRLYSSAGGSHELAQRAQGVLVFPRVLSAGFIVGAEHGDGALRAHGGTVGYFSTTSGSFGFTAGAQSKAIFIMFMTPDAYQKFVSSSGWTAGVDANVSIVKIGANGQIDTLTSQQPVIGFVQTNAGLMFDVSLNGTKINRLNI